MSKYTFYIIIGFVITISVHSFAQNGFTKQSNEITSSAIWGPGMSIMQAIRDSCSKSNAGDFGECFVKQMAKSGASRQAVRFAKMTGNQGYMRDFKKTGKVDIAFAVYPFRANENQLCFLVNGSPNMIDIDDYKFMPVLELKNNDEYKRIMKDYPNVSIWPGDRNGTEFPVYYNLAGGAQQFIFNYQLKDGCHACKIVGYANLAFNFDKSGSFKGVHVADVVETKQSRDGNYSIKGYSKSGKKIITKVGTTFNIILDANRTTGYEWQINNHLNSKIVKLVGKEYLPGRSTLAGAGGTEVWNFIASGSGQADIIFNYLRPWEKHTKPAKVDTFHVLIR